ncbi:MAG: aquaporin [Actinomycetota bacterium]|nr:aquaporin [Actinomycetota bacterium]
MNATAQAPVGGWHWVPWLCELLGTGTLLAGGLSAVFLDFGPSSPVAAHVPSTSARLLITGLLFAGTGSLVALSPAGRRSGAHLNPAVTFAFWTQRKVHPHDLAGYIVAQLLGALAACAVLRIAWGHTARVLHLGVTQPGHGFDSLDAVTLEMIMTASLILMILFMTSYPRSARWTPMGNWILVATLVWRAAPYTGTSLNPARSVAPAFVAPHLAHLWIYLAGPLGGAVLAVAIFAAFRDTHTLTAKLFHDPRYPTTMGSALPVTSS